MTPDGRPQVKDTNLASVRPGDVLMYRAGDLLWPDWDVLGGLIATLEGNTGTARDPRVPGHSKGDYTHCAWVRTAPDPEAEVEEVRPGIFRIKAGDSWESMTLLPGRWDEEPQRVVVHLASRGGTRIHATWPEVKEETVDWENHHMEVWRIRRASSRILEGILRLADDMLGWRYDLADFLTFGSVHLPGAEICSEFIKDPTYNASLLLSDAYPICLTPDLAGNADAQTVPNELINSEEMFRLRFQGLLGS